MLSVVVPVYKSAPTLPILVERIKGSLDSLGMPWEVILVDDGSGDDTLPVMETLREQYGNIACLSLEKNRGQQTALLAGLRAAEGEYVVTLDADLQHPPELIPALAEKLQEGWDVVYAVMEGRRDGFIRAAGSRLHDFTFNLLCRKPSKVRVGSYRILRKRVVKEIALMNPAFVYISAMMFKSRALKGNLKVTTLLFPYSPSKAPSTYNLCRLIRLFCLLAYHYSPLAGYKSLYSGKSLYTLKRSLPPLGK